MKQIFFVVILVMTVHYISFAQTDANNFYKSDKVKIEKVSFLNQYKMKIGGNLFLPEKMETGKKYPAIIVGHPMGVENIKSLDPLLYSKLTHQKNIRIK